MRPRSVHSNMGSEQLRLSPRGSAVDGENRAVHICPQMPQTALVMKKQPSLLSLASNLSSGRTTSQRLVSEALERIADPAGEGSRVFIKVHKDRALAAAAASDQLRAAGIVPSPLAGIPISVKDLFDLAGEPTTAGSKLLQNAPPRQVVSPGAHHRARRYRSPTAWRRQR